jgi:phosphatidylserine/phosphatidylglycerophosphate/cardiolipin synthase-like enzyme
LAVAGIWALIFGGRAEAAAPATAPATAAIQLVQSIPAETDLAQPDLPYAKDVWLEMIRGARSRLDIAQFYVSAREGGSAGGEGADEARLGPDPLAEVLAELERAGARGVKTRFLVSNDLLKDHPKTLERVKGVKGLELRVYDLSKITDGILHAKYWVVDGREVFVGSQNFDWRALSQIHETGARITDARLAAGLTRVFDVDWRLAGEGKAPDPRKLAREKRVEQGEIELVASPAQLNPPGIRAAEAALTELLGSARKSVRVQLLNYNPAEGKEFWPVIDNALRSAATRGVSVKLLVSDWNTKEPAFSHLRSLARIPGLEVRMASIPEHSAGKIPFARVIHSKYLLVDEDALWLGTSNWGRDYFRSSRNVELIIKRREPVMKVGEIFSKLWDSKYTKKID